MGGVTVLCSEVEQDSLSAVLVLIQPRKGSAVAQWWSA